MVFVYIDLYIFWILFDKVLILVLDLLLERIKLIFDKVLVFLCMLVCIDSK